ncbi:MAG: cation transport protein ChaC [Idiomarinaceae bacterium HL-53]|nr:MAG: cation transport protein ChaC [Idiomarinaceae bacterium HL-53]CUS47741.1 Cation transport regulator ChaC [Idiomarinaceae bacterium HL-53]
MPLAENQPVWVFGYGSLIYKVDFPYLERRPASIRGWHRRFWQGSHDHRGTPEDPGRVLTLVAEPNAECVGMAYLVMPDVFEHLDHREKNGYLRIETTFSFIDEQKPHTANGLVYIATAENAAYLGAATEREIAAHIARSSGPSGANDEYVLKLAQALRDLNTEDTHVFAIERYLTER